MNEKIEVLLRCKFIALNWVKIKRDMEFSKIFEVFL